MTQSPREEEASSPRSRWEVAHKDLVGGCTFKGALGLYLSDGMSGERPLRERNNLNKDRAV